MSLVNHLLFCLGEPWRWHWETLATLRSTKKVNAEENFPPCFQVKPWPSRAWPKPHSNGELATGEPGTPPKQHWGPDLQLALTKNKYNDWYLASCMVLNTHKKVSPKVRLLIIIQNKQIIGQTLPHPFLSCNTLLFLYYWQFCFCFLSFAQSD